MDASHSFSDSCRRSDHKHADLPFINQPIRIAADASNKKKGKGQIRFINVNQPQTSQDPHLQLTVEKIRLVTPKDEHKEAKIHRNQVHLNLATQDDAIARVDIKINNLKQYLHLSTDQIKNLSKKGLLADELYKHAESIIQSKKKDDDETSSSIIESVGSESESIDDEFDVQPEDSPEGDAKQSLVENEFPKIKWVPSGEQLDSNIREKITANLDQFGLTQQEFETLESFYIAAKEKLKSLAVDPYIGDPAPAYVNKNSTHPPLPHSIVFIPKGLGQKEGLYILTDKVIDIGTFNKVKLAIHLDSGDKKAFRSAASENVPDAERVINNRLIKDCEHFVVGVCFTYISSYKVREGIKGELRKSLEKFQNVEKNGMILDFIEGGELATCLTKSLDQTTKLQLACEYAEKIARLHKKGLIHFDQKSRNALVTADGKLKLCDFGLCQSEGTYVTYRGTPGYIAPELMSQQRCKAQYSMDTWQLGCVLFEIFYGSHFKNWVISTCYDKHVPIKDLDPHELEITKASILSNRNDPNHPDFHIAQCLQIDPTLRPKAEDIAVILKKLLG